MEARVGIRVVGGEGDNVGGRGSRGGRMVDGDVGDGEERVVGFEEEVDNG